MAISGDKHAFTQENIDRSPAEHGVYALYDGDTTIYFGRAAGAGVTIRVRLQAHKRGDEGRCTQSATHYRREVTEAAVSREKELLQEYLDKYGRLPRCNEAI
jgi:hypothetical protein